MVLILLFCILLLIFYVCYSKFKHYVPILMYHRIADVPGNRNALPPNKFESQLIYLSKNGYSTITMQMLYDYYIYGNPIPKKSVLLTFDDGYQDNFDTALPLLKKYKMSGVVFPISNWINKSNDWENFNNAATTTMSYESLIAWQNSGMEIASHTANHPFLAKCQSSDLKKELQESKSILEKRLHTPINFLCYPYGSLNAEVISEVKQAGYIGAFAIFADAPIWKINIFALPRIPIQSHQKMWEFKFKVSNIHIIFLLLRKLERQIKKIRQILRST